MNKHEKCMNKLVEIIPVFIDIIPDKLVHGKIYISLKYHTASHLCACGCGNKVVTPLKMNFWKLQVDDDERISLSPSIGNFNLPCKSHYFITKNKIKWV